MGPCYEYWLMDLQEKGFKEDTDLKDFIALINKAASEKHPLNVRRMDFITTTQSGTTLDLARALVAKIILTEWQNWGREAAILHFFMEKTTCEESRKVAHRLLRENPLGDY